MIVSFINNLILRTLLLGATATALAQTLPDLGEASQAQISATQERKIGESIMREIRASGAYLNDPEVTAYLNELGFRLVSASSDARQDFEFFAINDPAANAFALPGGFIGVHTGLLLLVQSESELASVLAHEITHVTQRHIVRMLVGSQRDALTATLAALAIAILAARSNPEASQAAIATGQALAIQSQLNFTREHEREADRIGLQVLTKAGFEGQAMATFMERMQRVSRISESKAPSYLRTHPITFERIAEIQDRLQGKAYRQVKDSPDFHYVRALVRSYQGEPREAVAYFEESLREKKYNDLAATYYGFAAALLRAKDFSRAEQQLTVLEKKGIRHPMLTALSGQVLLQSGQLKAALHRYQSALASYPNHKQLLYDYPDALLKDNQPQQAVEFLEKQLQKFPGDGALHQTAARAYASLDKRLLQHWHQGEYYAWLGNRKGAIDQFKLALKAGDGNFYQISTVEARLREVQRDLADQEKSLQASRQQATP